MAIECPECNNYFAGYKCGCGYKVSKPEAKDTQEGMADSNHLKCAAHGCLKPGSIRRTGSSQWLCADHDGHPMAEWQGITKHQRETYHPISHEEAHMIEVRKWLKDHGIERGKDNARYALSKMAYELANEMKRPMGKEWAYKILERVKNGERLPESSIELATEALKNE